jgi:hypothetical protein
MCPCDGPVDGTGKHLKDWTNHREYIDCVSKASLEAREMPKTWNIDDNRISSFTFSAVHSTCGGVPDDVKDGSWEQMKKVCPCEGAVGSSTPWNDHEEYLECMEQALMDLAVSNPNLSNTVVGTDLAKATFDDCGNKPAPAPDTKLSFAELRQHFEKDCPCTDGPFSNHDEYMTWYVLRFISSTMMLINYFIVHQTKWTTSCTYMHISNYFTCVVMCILLIVVFIFVVCRQPPPHGWILV